MRILQRLILLLKVSWNPWSLQRRLVSLFTTTGFPWLADRWQIKPSLLRGTFEGEFTHRRQEVLTVGNYCYMLLPDISGLPSSWQPRRSLSRVLVNRLISSRASWTHPINRTWTNPSYVFGYRPYCTVIKAKDEAVGHRRARQIRVLKMGWAALHGRHRMHWMVQQNTVIELVPTNWKNLRQSWQGEENSGVNKKRRSGIPSSLERFTVNRCQGGVIHLESGQRRWLCPRKRQGIHTNFMTARVRSWMVLEMTNSNQVTGKTPVYDEEGFSEV